MHPIWQFDPTMASELEKVVTIMKDAVNIRHPEIKQRILDYIDAPGKYLRSGSVLLFARLYHHGEIPSQKYTLAAAVELLHLATLLHDDVIDRSDTRRGVETLNVSASNRIAIYAGDYLLTAIAQLVRDAYDQEELADRYSWTINALLNGEISQLANSFNPALTLNQYLKQIRRKTALLFALSTYSGYYHEGISARKAGQAFGVGVNFGMAFQIIDDLIDYRAVSGNNGKPMHQDIQNGFYTVPLLFVREKDTEQFNELIRLDFTDPANIERLDNAILAADGFAKSADLARGFLNKAHQQLRRLPGRQVDHEAIEALGNYFVEQINNVNV
ncbi:MAG: polyprenyl synthetase family protein [Aerococcus sp.]|nr:polyprenyl synthetase family protein [Aerococcus sp.]